ncbi:MAG: hypothetical protein ACOX5R_07235 [bacterium]
MCSLKNEYDALSNYFFHYLINESENKQHQEFCKICYSHPDYIEDYADILIVPYKDYALLFLNKQKETPLRWFHPEQVFPPGYKLPFTDPIPVLFWGEGYEDGSQPFVEQREDGSVVFYADIIASAFFHAFPLGGDGRY